MIDPDGPRPVYRQIADLIAARIESGDLPAGKRIPTELEIQQTYGVARATARRAVEDLRSRGLVYTVPQRGTYVGTDPDE